MALFRVTREIVSLSEGVVEAETPSEAEIKIKRGEWEYGRTTTESDKIVSCDLIELIKPTPNPKDL
jgi:hypothetical protein